MERVRKLYCTFFVYLAALLLSACGQKDPASGANMGPEASHMPTPTATPLVSLADLRVISERGSIRLIAPRFDGADALPRHGVSVKDYQNLAERFASRTGLEVQWVYVDSFADLIPTLNAGKGDVVVTNMTVTKARSKQVAFTRAIAQVNEVVVTKADADVTSEEAINALTFGVPDGTVYSASLADAGVENIQLLPGNTSATDVLSGLAENEYQATVLDHDVADLLLREYPDLAVKYTLKKHRPIAWAVRKQNTKLLEALNQFLISHHVKAATLEKAVRSWEDIKASGRLRMLTLNNPSSYFMWRGELMGFDYELLKHFSDQHGLHLSVILKDDIQELFDALKNGEGDVIAASLTVSEKRQKIGVEFSKPYLKVKEQVVGLKGKATAESLSEMAGYKVGVNPNKVFFDRLIENDELKAAGNIIEYPGESTENIIERLYNGEIDFTFADSHLVSIEETFNQAITVQFDLGDTSNIAWGLRPDQATLKSKLNEYISKEYRGLFYNVVFKKYFKNKKRIVRHQKGRITAEGALSPYDDIVKTLAQQHDMDWRLVVAQMYQESKFNPKAKSFAGAEGLMQVMPRTAKQLGIEDVETPVNGITAGVSYMKWLEKRFPGELDLQERIYFTLAAYNAGAGHVRDARRLASKLGYDANRWFDNTEHAMLKLSQKKYYQKARFGYVRGSEPVEYVRKIRDRYLNYIENTK